MIERYSKTSRTIRLLRSLHYGDDQNICAQTPLHTIADVGAGCREGLKRAQPVNWVFSPRARAARNFLRKHDHCAIARPEIPDVRGDFRHLLSQVPVQPFPRILLNSLGQQWVDLWVWREDWRANYASSTPTCTNPETKSLEQRPNNRPKAASSAQASLGYSSEARTWWQLEGSHSF